jgi:hypothetical protein
MNNVRDNEVFMLYVIVIIIHSRSDFTYRIRSTESCSIQIQNFRGDIAIKARFIHLQVNLSGQ